MVRNMARGAAGAGSWLAGLGVLALIALLAFIGLFAFIGLLAGPLRAQGAELPYWASIRYDKVYMRVGPGATYPIDWVYSREGLPVRVVRKREGWRLVRDPDGTQGWIAASQLRRARSVIVIGEGLAALREEPRSDSALRFRAQPGVVARLVQCSARWCEIDAAGRTGWVEAARLWGDEEAEAEPEGG